MTDTSLVIIGGFLGAGKTTSILAMARHMLSRGLKIGIVTNDQGSRLVDTAFLASSGLPVLEVEGGCFCCNFDEFTNKVNQLTDEQKPDVILAEPVGSCTDLIATIYKPLQKQLTRQFVLRPLSIVVDPKRLRRLMMESDSPFPNEINYLFRKQLEEADIIALNKTDCLDEHETKEMLNFLRAAFKGAIVIAISAKTGLNIELWAQTLSNSIAPSDKKSLDIDYKTYALAESYLGWLNYRSFIKASTKIDWNSFLEGLMECINKRLQHKNAEIAHLKAYCIGDDEWDKVSITSTQDVPDFNNTMSNPADNVQLIINARVNTDPDNLKGVINAALDEYIVALGLEMSNESMECFSPSEPKPKYRINS